MKKIIAAGVATLGVIGTTAGLLSGTAHAATVASIHIPAVSITTMNNIKVRASVTGADPSGMTYYDWDVKTSPNVSNASTSDLGFYAGSPGNWFDGIEWWPGLNPLGEFHAYPASDRTGAENTTTFWVKLGGREQVHVSRSGSHVSVHACIQRYNDNLDGFFTRGGWRNWAGHSTTVYQFRSGRWVTIRSMTTGTNGCTPTYTFTYAAARQYHAVTTGTTTIWGATSATVTR